MDFLVVKLNPASGATDTNAFRYGDNTGTEESHGLEYVESETAAIVTFKDGSANELFIAK